MVSKASGRGKKNDLTELEKLKNQLRKKELVIKELEQQSELREMKSRFLSIASHEFKTPLAGMLSSLNLIDRYIEADLKNWIHFKNRKKVENHLRNMHASVKNMTTILNKFLSLGNIEKGEIAVNKIRFSIRKMLQDHTAQFQQICKAGQQIVYMHKGRNTMVYLDKHIFKNIVNNLLSNAIKFSPEHSEIELTSSIIGNQLTIKLTDQGIGIPASDQQKIFRRFFRATNALTNQEGTGLGLHIVKKYTGLLNGDISFESEENSGTTFELTFPISSA